MSFLKKMFAKKDPVEEMRQLYARKDWAGVLSVSRQLDREALEPELLKEIDGWQHQAGDALAVINLEEGEWAQKSGNLLRAREDFQLAIDQARSDGLRERAKQALAALDRGEPVQQVIGSGDSEASHDGCSSCTISSGEPSEHQEMDLDEEARMELLLATMPPELSERYLAAGVEFRQAWLAMQDGDEDQALALLQQVPEAAHDALFFFERGALMARRSQHDQALQDLQAALSVEPDLFPAFDVLVDVMISLGRTDEVEKLLRQSIGSTCFVGYCWARLAELHARRSELEPALAAGLKALEEGVTDQGLIMLCAQLLESAGRYDEAEALLRRLPTAGCGGGVHPMLAEFWLRHGQQLDNALESFKGALRQERDNPRWLLRIAQVYLAKGWRKDAADQLQRLMKVAELPEQIREEARVLADRLQNS
ncbi:MAG: tetratricopeptide repeat protein [Desulfuromonadales bacterium]